MQTQIGTAQRKRAICQRMGKASEILKRLGYQYVDVVGISDDSFTFRLGVNVQVRRAVVKLYATWADVEDVETIWLNGFPLVTVTFMEGMDTGPLDTIDPSLF